MKVLAKVDHRKYLCEIDHTEIEKFLNLYYGNLKELKVGDEIDLGVGYDWNRDTKDALKKTEEFFKANTKIIKTITHAFNLDLKESHERT